MGHGYFLNQAVKHRCGAVYSRVAVVSSGAVAEERLQTVELSDCVKKNLKFAEVVRTNFNSIRLD